MIDCATGSACHHPPKAPGHPTVPTAPLHRIGAAFSGSSTTATPRPKPSAASPEATSANARERPLALAVRQWAPILPRFTPGSSFAELMRAMAEAVLASIPDRRPAAVGALTFRAYALRHETVRASFSKEMAKGLAAGATWMQTVFAADGLPMPAEIMVRVINSLIEGLSFQRFLTPELMPDEVFYAAFAALATRPSPNVQRGKLAIDERE